MSDTIRIVLGILFLFLIYKWIQTAYTLHILRQQQKGAFGLLQGISTLFHGQPLAPPPPATPPSNPWGEILFYLFVLGLLLWVLPYTYTA